MCMMWESDSRRGEPQPYCRVNRRQRAPHILPNIGPGMFRSGGSKYGQEELMSAFRLPAELTPRRIVQHSRVPRRFEDEIDLDVLCSG